MASDYTVRARFEVNVPGDLNNDREVNILDIAIVAFTFGCTPEDVNWNITADVNQDEVINVVDLAIVARVRKRRRVKIIQENQNAPFF